MKRQSSIEKLHAEFSDLISKHLNGVISARDLITMHHNLYYDFKEMHKQEIIDAYRNGGSNQQSARSSIFHIRTEEQYYKNTYEK